MRWSIRRVRTCCGAFAGPIAVAIAAGLAGCGRPEQPPAPAPEAAAEATPADLEAQVHSFCGACHRYPAPDTFPRANWRAEVERGYRFFKSSRLALNPPPLDQAVRYYEERAPQDYPPLQVTPPSDPGVHFERVSYPPPPGPRPWVSHVQAVKLPPPGVTDPAAVAREPVTLIACDMDGGGILALRPADPAPAWRVLAKARNPARVEVADLDRDGVADLLVSELGSFTPTDRLLGGVTWLRGKRDGTFEPVPLLSVVGRVADVRAAEFCGSGKLDLVVAVFGLHDAGEILLLENQTADWKAPKFARRTLDPRHGTIHVPVADLNGDGKPDFVALISQEHEQVVAFLNEGGGKFRRKELYAAPHPGWGSSGVELTDLNGDGRLDVLYTNGDVLDQPHLWKPFHGVQWLENKGGLNFEYHRIGELCGAHHAVAAPVTGGKLPDVLAVSFLPTAKFPDRERRRPDAVMLFEQVGPGKFVRHRLATGSCDAVACCAADLYGTGRRDLVIGNFGAATTDHPVTIWKNLGRSRRGAAE
jgi:hypothetical protein